MCVSVDYVKWRERDSVEVCVGYMKRIERGIEWVGCV